MKILKLTQNKVSLLDDIDFEKASQFKWYARKDSKYAFYAQRKFNIDGTWKNIMLHRYLLNPPADMYIDHINHDGLDNRRCNLRIVTHSQNHFNERIRTDNSSGFKGIHWNKKNNNWNVHLANKYLGSFNTIEEACNCRNFHFNKLKL